MPQGEEFRGGALRFRDAESRPRQLRPTENGVHVEARPLEAVEQVEGDGHDVRHGIPRAFASLGRITVARGASQSDRATAPWYRASLPSVHLASRRHLARSDAHLP